MKRYIIAVSVVIILVAAGLFVSTFATSIDGPDAQDIIQGMLPHPPKTVTYGRTRGVPVRSRVIHILNWHWLPKEMFAADLRASSEKDFSDNEIQEQYARFLDDVEAVQLEQVEILRYLIEQHGLKKVYLEGLTSEEMPALHNRIESMRKFSEHMPDGETPLDEFMLIMFREDQLRLGAPGRLLLSGELEAVLPADDAELLKKANPIHGESVEIDKEVNERREDAITKNILSEGEVVLIVMGGAHDLSNNVPDTCEYITVATKKYIEVGME